MPSLLVGNTAPDRVDVPGTRSASNQLRVSLTSPAFAYSAANDVRAWAKYLLQLALRAVLPVPNRSYATDTRGAMSLLQFGRLVSSGKKRAGTKRPAGTEISFIRPLKYSMRTPGLSVRRLMVHVSWT